jgi:ADP-ribosyl-[dinitrogen reductase] hydrolase
MTPPSSTAIIGCLLGTAVGDALGLPYEGLSPQRQRRLFPHPDRHHLVFGKGMVSDDTEHTCMVAQSLIVAAGNSAIFTRNLAGRLRWWLLRLPAGVGLATLRSICKLWLGFSPSHSGVYSAGNGAAMRSAIIGVCYGDRPQLMVEMVQCSTRITHSDRKAEFGAIAVALAAYLSSTDTSIDPHEYIDLLSKLLPPTATEFLDLIKLSIGSVESGETTPKFAINMGWKRGISGYVYQTVPIAIHAWLSHPENYRDAVLAVIKCGGDTDTTAAIVGGIIGSRVGKIGIPTDWLTNLAEFPCNINYLENLGSRLALSMLQSKGDINDRNPKQSPPSLPVYLICLRNLFFLLVVIFHGFRRCLP